MKKTLLHFLTAAIIAAPTVASAQPYVSGSFGLSMLTELEVDYNGLTIPAEFKTGYSINGAVGYDFGQQRAELAIGYQQNDLDSIAGQGESFWNDYGIDINKVDSSALTVMANGYYDITMDNSPIEPYAMAGIGLASLDLTGFEGDTYFAWQVGAGVGIELDSDLTLDLGYRYLKPTGVKLEGHDASIGSHNIMVGVRYALN